MRWTAPSIHGVPPKPRKYHNANVVDDLMLVMFGIGNGPFSDIGILSTSTWSWTTQYISNPAWLSGNLSASHGLVKNSTGTYSTDTRSSSRDPDDAPYVQEQNITAPIDTNSDPQITTGKHIRITAGVIAGVLSGGVVVVTVSKLFNRIVIWYIDDNSRLVEACFWSWQWSFIGVATRQMRWREEVRWVAHYPAWFCLDKSPITAHPTFMQCKSIMKRINRMLYNCVLLYLLAVFFFFQCIIFCSFLYKCATVTVSFAPKWWWSV